MSRAGRKGQSAVEFAMAAPALVLLLLVIVDFGRFFFVATGVTAAARAGAQYGSQTLGTASDNSGMTSASNTQWNNTALSLTVTPSQCTCVSGSSLAACPVSYCTDDAQATFVEVDTQVTYAQVTAYLKIPAVISNLLNLQGSATLKGKAIMQVQQ